MAHLRPAVRGMSAMTTPNTPASAWLASLLTAVVVGLVVLVGFKAQDALQPAQGVPAESSQLLNEDERAVLLADAADLSERVLTYHDDRFDRDLKAASARLTPEFGTEFAQAMEKVRANTVKNRISQEATAVSSAIVTANQDEARVLVFLNQETSSARTKANQLVRNRLVVDLVRLDGRWTIAGLNALG